MLGIAVRMLFGDRSAVVGMLLGLGCAAMLIALQGAIFCGIMSRAVALMLDTRGVPIWAMDPTVQFIDDIKPLDDSELQRVRGVPGVAWAAPYYKGMLRARLADGSYQACHVIGLDGASLFGGPPELPAATLAALHQADAVIVDAAGAAAKLAQPDGRGGHRPLAPGDTIELNDRRAVVVGLCTVSRGFGGQPTIYTTWERARSYALRERRQLSFVVAGPVPGQDPAAVARRIADATGLAARTREDFLWHTVGYYMRNTPIPMNIGIGVILSFVVGTAITGLTFGGFVHNHLRHLGALKAMGATNRLLLGLTLFQALLIGAMGYGIGVGTAAFLGHALRHTEMAFVLTWQMLVIDAGLVLTICLLAATASLRAVFRLEPAAVFRT